MTIPIDPNNPVVKLCAEGIRAEDEGRLDDAHKLFLQAWAARQDDFDACIAAHFLARHRPPKEMLHWNQAALAHADAVGDERVQDFYSSLYLNMGWSHEQLGELAEAGRYYAVAVTRLAELPAGPYTDVVRKGVAAGQARLVQVLGEGLAASD
jgi:hypothetical protein